MKRIFAIICLVLIFTTACSEEKKEFQILAKNVTETTGWQSAHPGWQVSNGVYEGTNTGSNIPTETIWLAGENWTSYEVNADVQLGNDYEPSDAQLIFRYQNPQSYGACRLWQYKGVYLELLDTTKGVLIQKSFPAEIETWYRLNATIHGDYATCEVIGYSTMRISGKYGGATNGTVGLRNTHIEARFRDVLVRLD